MTRHTANDPTATNRPSPPPCAIELSIVIPAHDEQDNVADLVTEITQTIAEAGINLELVIVDDGSTDDTRQRLLKLSEQCPWLVVLTRDRPMGQSAAMYAGIQAARGHYIATLDADLQNDPADLLAMLDKLKSENADMVQGDRSRNRRDSLARRVSSTIGRTARALLLGDRVRDTGCSARVMKQHYAKQIPLLFRGMHRFIPVYVRMLGGNVIETAANHRPRAAGTTKYGVGVFSRGLAGLVDCLAVRWMIKRYRDPSAQPVKERKSC